MADKKISQLTAITAPISGTDVLPIVQSSTTKKITVAQLVPGLGSFTAPSGNVKGLVWTDGTVLANDATVTDVGYDTSTNTVQAKNLTVASTATITNGNLVIGTSGKGIDFSATPSTGTSELLADYEEGTWTPTDVSGAGLSFSNQSGYYTKIGRIVNCYVQFQFPVTADGSQARISLPFTALNSNNIGGGVFYVNSPGIAGAQMVVVGNASYLLLSNVSAGTAYLNTNASGIYFRGFVSYIV